MERGDLVRTIQSGISCHEGNPEVHGQLGVVKGCINPRDGAGLFLYEVHLLAINREVVVFEFEVEKQEEQTNG